jgi:adenylate cyclase class 2
MAEMERARREIEVKLRFDSPGQASLHLERIGARLVRERTFEDNIVYDDDRGSLVAAGKLLRLRRWGDEATLTYKAPVEGSHRHKVREEHETVLDRPAAVERIFAGLGFHPVYRYQKYRTLYALGDLHACLDETPLGCFVELEGAPDAIDRAAEAMGASRERYILSTYRELHEQEARARGQRPGDLVFDEAGEDGR